MAEIKGLAHNSQSVEFITKNGGTIKNDFVIDGDLYIDGEIIEPTPPYEIVTFADGTDEQINAMLEAHYRGDININDYWKVGDTRKIHVNAIAADSDFNAHAAQDIEIKIIGIEADDLTEQRGTRTKAAVTVQCVQILGNNGTVENEHFWGKRYTSVSFVYDTPKASESPMRNVFLNSTFYNALSDTFRPILKEVNKSYLKEHANWSSYILGPEYTEIVSDKVFLLSVTEVLADELLTAAQNQPGWMEYQGRQTSEGYQYEYYKTQNNRIKYANKNGTNGTAQTWWLRSPSCGTGSQSGPHWTIITNAGAYQKIWYAYGGNWYSSTPAQAGVCPAFCL